MPLKNPKHEIFAQELANGENATQAYRNAGFADSRANACRLQQDERVRQRVNELMEQRARRHDKATEKAISELGLTKQWVLARLVENAEQALIRKDGSVANRALELIGKEQGMFIDRKETGQPGDFAALTTPDQVLAAIRAEFGDAAAALLTIAKPETPSLDDLPTQGDAIN